MQILLTTDIFGETGHVGEIAARLQERGHIVKILSPYAEPRSFGYEDEAYAFFTRECGVEAYAEKIRETLREMVGPLICLGFSAGAAALWKALACPEAGCAEMAILFYGGQIRAAAELQPLCETLLVFPAEEPHFSVADLIDRLQGRPDIFCTKVPWLHGYMNRLSGNFDQEGSRRTLAWLDELLDQPRRVTGKDAFRQLLRRG